MQQVIAHYVSREMAVLGLIEAIFSFVAIYVLITLADASAALPAFVDTLPHDSVALAAIITAIPAATGLTTGLYRADLDRGRLIVTTGLVATIAFLILLAVSTNPDTGLSAAHASFIAEMLGAWLVTMILIRLIYGLAAQRTTLVRRIMLVGDPNQAVAFNARLRTRRGRSFEPVPLRAQKISWSLLREQRIWGVVLIAEPDAAAVTALLDCKLRGTKIIGATAFHENYLGRIDLDTLSANDLLTARGFIASSTAAAVKRISDVILSVIMLFMTLPLMALTALAIKFDSAGPVFYRQQRAGQFDRPFTLLKFRSMTADAEANGNPRWAQRHDPRVTRVGRFIRATRIDELPQLVNVIRGEMSLVGPRPERPHFVEQLARAIPFYRQRSYVKPGVTGWAQINFPYGASIADAREKLAYDLYYVKNRSLLLDAVILLSTIRVVLFQEGAR